MSCNVGYGRIAEDPRHSQAERDEALENEAKEQVSSKFIDGNFNEEVTDLFWNASGEAKEEIESMFLELAGAFLKGELGNDTRTQATRKLLRKWRESAVKEETNLILENA